MFFTRRGACTPRGKVIWQKRARRWNWTKKSAGERVAATGKCSSPAGISDPEGEGYLTPSGGEPELDNAKSAGERLLPTVI
ncbi:hypothetical protein C1N76_05960 [Geobacillus thermoleovorans]|uniref:Uncharacterized protein n=2 Tax=Geobacillus TaxID=129337 RepID=A0A2Z3N5E3_GEOTH|nr:hypothetical protein C1N76_05960 [Geobacillus thermoleovorans]